jgi:uncharacterized protein
MFFDFRVFLGRSFDGAEQTAEELLVNMDRLKIDRALVCPFKPISYDLNQANTWLASQINKHPDRLVGAARVDPWQPDAIEILKRAFEMLGLRALYLNPWEECFRIDMEQLCPLVDALQSYRAPLLVAAGYPWVSEAFQVQKLAARWPGVSIVMSNGGQINISGLGQADVTQAMKISSNLSIDTAGVYRQDFIEETVQTFGADRVLFGSGAPYFDQGYETMRIRFAKVSAVEESALQAENAKRLLNLSPSIR